MSLPKLSRDHCILEDWQQHASPDFQKLSPAAVLARCRRGDGPRYQKILGERSAPVWLKADVVVWFKEVFQIHYPEAVQSLLDSNFPDVPAPKKPKAKRKSKRNV